MNIQFSRLAPSAHKFDFAVTITIVAILSTLLLVYLNNTQKKIEKVNVNSELNYLRLGLAEAWVHKSINNQSIDNTAMENSNPMLLLAEKPKNYIGEHSKPPINRKEIWYFDTTEKKLIYIFNDGNHAKYRFSKTAGQAKASLLSVGGLDLVKDEVEVN